MTSLRKIAFTELAGTPRAWHLQDLSLGPINLIVGANASGKTRVINLISGFASLLSGRRKTLYETGDYRIEFEVEGEPYEYRLKVADFVVTFEKLTSPKRVLLSRRKGGAGKIYAEGLRRDIDFHTPTDQLALVARQDRKQHPTLIKIAEWGSAVVTVRFGTTLGRDALVARSTNGITAFDRKNTDQVPLYLIEGMKRFGAPFKAKLLRDLREVGYAATDVGLRLPPGVETPFEKIENIFVHEEGMDGPTDQIYMSQGMFRALSLLIELNYITMSGIPFCLLVDDVGEGLDFDRSSLLIDKVIATIQDSNDQLVMTTNDRFTMNAVPLEYWTVLARSGHSVRALNATNSAKTFKDFSYTGLSNFDFFASGWALPHN